jgi:hypothetical protein
MAQTLGEWLEATREAIAHLLGLDSPNSPWYLWWSGAGAEVPRLLGLWFLLHVYRQHVCYKPGCLRWGYPVPGQEPLRSCRKHWPKILPPISESRS